MADGGTISVPAALSTVGAAFNATVNIAHIIYDLKAVGEQARNLLDSTNHISSTLDTTRSLRRQKDTYLNEAERKWIDGVCRETESILKDIAALIEPARVDMETRKSGRVSILTRGMFVLRDSPKVASNLSRLNLTTQGLNAALIILSAKSGGPPRASNFSRYSSTETLNSSISHSKAPPTYDESEFINRKRRYQAAKGPRHRDSRASMSIISSEDSAFRLQYVPEGHSFSDVDWIKETSEPNETVDSNTLEPDTMDSSKSPPMIAKSIGENASINLEDGIPQPSSLEQNPDYNISRIMSTCSLPSAVVSLEGADGLQVVDQPLVNRNRSQSYQETDFLNRRRRIRTPNPRSPSLRSVESNATLSSQAHDQRQSNQEHVTLAHQMTNSRPGPSVIQPDLSTSPQQFEGADGLQVVEGPTTDQTRAEKYGAVDFLHRRRSPQVSHQPGSKTDQRQRRPNNDSTSQTHCIPYRPGIYAWSSSPVIHEVEACEPLPVSTENVARLSALNLTTLSSFSPKFAAAAPVAMSNQAPSPSLLTLPEPGSSMDDWDARVSSELDISTRAATPSGCQ